MKTPGFNFQVTASNNHARCTILQTPRAAIETPVFMPVGTQATVKSLTPTEVASTGAKIILANTYHLWLRPGPELIEQHGGVPQFMNWPHALLTDSGGFQVFSLGKLRKIKEEGVTFRSHLNGELKHLSPEEAMRIQKCLGSDIAMVLDVCPPGDAPKEEIQKAVDISTRWAIRSLNAPAANNQARFGIVQGGKYVDLRLSHLETIASLPVDGIALGGFSVGEPPEEMYEALEQIVPKMPMHLPRYLMGVGTPQDLIIAIGFGIDMFDCVLPTRNARNGQALTWNGRVNLKQSRHVGDESPIDSNCACETCTQFTRSYLRHLFKSHEMLGPRLVTLHNLFFYSSLVQQARTAIEKGQYTSWSTQTLQQMKDGDEITAM